MKIYDQLDDIEKTLASTPLEDKEILRVRRIASHLGFNNATNYHLFAECVKKVARIESSILKPRGFTLDSDMNEVVTFYEKKLEEAEAELDRLNSEEHFEDLVREAEEKKEKLKINGATLQERVKEFSATNYLLSYPFNPTKVYDELPTTEFKPADKPSAKPNDDLERRKRMAAARARASLALNL